MLNIKRFKIQRYVSKYRRKIQTTLECFREKIVRVKQISYTKALQNATKLISHTRLRLTTETIFFFIKVGQVNC